MASFKFIDIFLPNVLKIACGPVWIICFTNPPKWDSNPNIKSKPANTDTNKTADKPNNTIFLKSNLTSNINIMNSKYAIHSDIDAPTLAPIDGKAVVIRVIMANITVNHFGIFL